MEDYKLVIYIVLGALYYGFKFISKKKQEASAPIQPKPKQEKKRPSTIDELLQEVKREQEGRQKPVYKPFYETQENTPIETIDYESSPEKVVIEKVNPYLAYRTLDAKTVEDGASRFAEFVTGPPKKHPILESFKDKKKVREAFIFTEIFNKRAY